MKSKKILVVNFIILTLIAMILLTSCAKFKTGITLTGDTQSAKTISNSGLVLNHGDYKYFINGYVPATDIKEPSDNEFGKMKKGAIYRMKNVDGAKAELVVPTVVYSNAKGSGLVIYGNWIYYTTPSTDLHKTTGAIQTSFLNYMRTSLDGKNTQLVSTIKGNDVKHKFTKDGLMYFKEGSLYVKKYNEKLVEKKEKEIASGIETIVFPYSSDTSNNVISKYAFYTTKTEDYLEGAKVIKIDINGKNEEVKLDKAEYSLKTWFDEGENHFIYFTKSIFDGNAVNNVGLFRVSLNNDGSINQQSVKKVVNGIVSDSLVVMNNEVFFIRNQQLIGVQDNVEKIYAIDFPTSATLIAKEGRYMVYTSDGYLYKLDISDGATTLPQKISNIKVFLTWYQPEFLEGKVYYIADSDKQLYRNDIEDVDKEGLLIGEAIEKKESK